MGGLASSLDDMTGDFFDFDASKIADAEQEARRIQERSAQKNIEAQQAQIRALEEITSPYRALATETALPALSALAFGGEAGYQPSKLFQQQLELGKEGILQQQAAKGTLKSSNTFQRLSDLVSGLAAEDVGRYETTHRQLLNIGLGAESLLAQAGSRLTGNIGDILTNLGPQLFQGQQSLAQAQTAGGQTLGQGISSLANLL